MSTIKDVASHAGVSIATVSNYMNHTKPVSKAVSARIKAAIEELQYSQNLTAKNLKSSTYNDIGIILPNFNDSYYVQIFQGIEYAFQNSPYYLNLTFSYDIPEIEQQIVQNMLRKQVCGLILVSCQQDGWKFYYENFNKQNRPIVLIDRLISSLDANFVSFDNRTSIREMTQTLLDSDYQKIYLMTGPLRFTSESECVKGFTEAYESSDRAPHKDAIIQTDLNKEDAFRKITGLLKKDTPDIVMTTSETIANGVIEGLHILGYSTQNIPVVTLGEEHWNKYTRSFANFSTARPAMKLGAKAANLLVEKLQSPQLQESDQIILNSNEVHDATMVLSALKAPANLQPSAAVGSKKNSIRILMLDTPLVHSFHGLLRNFETQTGIRVDITILQHHRLYDAIVDSSLSDKAENRYDVYMYDIPWLGLLANQGILADISSFMHTIDVSKFLPGSLEYFSKFQDKYFGLPFMYAPQILYYRKDLFDSPALRNQFEKQFGSPLRPPVSLREYNAMAEFFTSKTNAIPYGVSIPAAYDECLAPELYMRLRSYGSEIIDSNGNVVFDNPKTLKAYINFIQILRYAKPDYLNANDVSIVDSFLSGETAMLISYPSFLTNINDLRKSSMIGSIGYNHIPGNSPLLGGWSLGVSERSPNKDSAMAFIRWTCNEQMDSYFALLGGQSAITRTYTNDELVKFYPWLPLYRSVYSYTKPMLPPILRDGQVMSPNAIDAIICKWAYQLINGEAAIEEVIPETQRELEIFIGQKNER